MDNVQILAAGDEGAGDIVHLIGDAEEDVLFVLFAEVGLAEDFSREAHALAVREHAADFGGAVDVLPLDLVHLEGEQSVVEEDGVTGLQVVDQARIGDGHLRLTAFHVPGGEGEGISILQRNFPLGKGLDAELRTLGVEHNGDGKPQRFAHLFDGVHFFQMFLVTAMGKVKPSHIHTGLAQFGQYFLTLAGGTNGTNDFCLTHK